MWMNVNEKLPLKIRMTDFWMKTILINRFGHMIPAYMIRCPNSKDRTPLNSIEIRDGPGDKRLATPFTEAGNTESGDRCMYTGNSDGDAIWTDRCSNDNPWHGWEFRSVGGANFLLVHKVTGRCAIPSGGEGSWLQTFACNSGNTRMIWSLTDGNWDNGYVRC